MLTDDDVTMSNQSLSGSIFTIVIIPGISVLNFHGNVIGTKASFDTEIESSVTGDNFSIVESTDITNLPVAIGILVLGSIEFIAIN